MLYLMEGMPASAQFLIMVCNCSMSRSRSAVASICDAFVINELDAETAERCSPR